MKECFKKRLGFVIGEWNICVFPLTLMIAPVTREDGKEGSSIAIGFLIWSITIYVWRK